MIYEGCRRGYFLNNLSNEYIDKISSIEDQAKTVVNVTIKYNVSRSKKLLERLLKMLKNIENEEFDFLNQFLAEYFQ